MTIREALAEGTGRLKSPCALAFIDTPALDASILLAYTLGTNKTELILSGNKNIDEKTREKYTILLERRRSGECIAYILGRKEFRGLEFFVNTHVLVPRPDTETLVEAALEYIDPQKDNASLSVLDLCTGSGALAISLKNERPFLHVTASDICPAALETAAENVRQLLGEELSQRRKDAENAEEELGIRDCGSKVTGVSSSATLKDNKPRVQIIQSNLFEDIPFKFNIIVSNPPYVPSNELTGLAPEVRREPSLALDGGEDGLLLIRKIIAQAPDHLLPGGILLLEAAPGQMPSIRELLEGWGFNDVKVYKDLAGRDRVISGLI